jgi:transposase InsO family protein
MCKVLEVSRSAYYKWKLNGDPQHIKRHDMLIVDIKQAHGNSHKIYGSPRITQKLTDKGILVSKSTVARLMKSNSVKSKVKKKYRATTDSKHDFKIADNLLDRNFNVPLLNSVWISDITYIKIGSSWYYLTIIMDLADRMIIAWHLSSNLTAHDTVMRTWNKALEVRVIKQPLIFHSDRGVQYACDDFKDLLKESKMVTQSMSRKSNCWDNAVAESFFKTLKTEFVYHHVFANYEQAYRLIFQYIEAWYNTNRIHSSINNLSPLQMHLKLLINIAA